MCVKPFSRRETADAQISTKLIQVHKAKRRVHNLLAFAIQETNEVFM